MYAQNLPNRMGNHSIYSIPGRQRLLPCTFHHNLTCSDLPRSPPSYLELHDSITWWGDPGGDRLHRTNPDALEHLRLRLFFDVSQFFGAARFAVATLGLTYHYNHSGTSSA